VKVLLAIHRVHHSDGSNLYDISHFVTSLHHMDGRAHAKQDRADSLGIAETG